jgi:hypothetical protein
VLSDAIKYYAPKVYDTVEFYNQLRERYVVLENKPIWEYFSKEVQDKILDKEIPSKGIETKWMWHNAYNVKVN